MGRLQLNDSDRVSLTEIGKRLARRTLDEAAQIVPPETILAWNRRLFARKFDGFRRRLTTGRPGTNAVFEELIIRMAQENRTWG
jgi:putative transposase